MLAGLALLPLVIAQGGNGTQWIGRWALSSRLSRPRSTTYRLLGCAPSGTGRLLVALPALPGLVIGVLALADARAESSARASADGWP